MFYGLLSTLLFNINSFTETRAPYSVSLASTPLCFSALGLQRILVTHSFSWELQSEFKSSCLCKNHFSSGAISTALVIMIMHYNIMGEHLPWWLHGHEMLGCGHHRSIMNDLPQYGLISQYIRLLGVTYLSCMWGTVFSLLLKMQASSQQHILVSHQTASLLVACSLTVQSPQPWEINLLVNVIQYSSLVYVDVINTMNQNNLKKKFIWLVVWSAPSREARWELEHGTWSGDDGETLLIDFTSSTNEDNLFLCLSELCAMVALALGSHSFSHQPLIEKMPHRLTQLMEAFPELMFSSPGDSSLYHVHRLASTVSLGHLLTQD